MIDSLIPHLSDLPAYGRLALLFMVANAVLELLGTAFGPFVHATFPKAYGPIAALGKGLREALNNASSVLRLLGPVKSTQARPPKPPVLPVLLVMAMTLTACPRLPDPSGCRPNEMRCHDGRPQVCSGSTRWVNADRPCSEVGAVCCLAQHPGGEVYVWACVPQDRCVPDPQADAGDDR